MKTESLNVLHYWVMDWGNCSEASHLEENYFVFVAWLFVISLRILFNISLYINANYLVNK